uniref:Fatty acid hydroxylase domain-containing protein n=1 Tax=Alexandrium andersonii TaxID=327968 RepID=A0A7S2DTR8_9DINO
MDFVRGNIKLLRTFLACHRILYRLPKSLYTIGTSCEIHVPAKPRELYEAEVRALQEYVTARTPAQRPADITLALLMAQRTLWVAAAASQNFTAFVLAGLLQFVVAPYSFGISLLTSGMYFMTFCLGHLVTALVLQPLPLPSLFFEIDGRFIAGLLCVDFLVNCFYAFIKCKSSKPKRFPLKKSLQHIAYGTFNTKTYLLLVFLFCRGSRFNLCWLLVDAALGLGALVNNLVQRSCLSWECIFYNAHRLGHLRVIYEHAHKAHHRLTDTLAFDAHAFSGNGFPEEWFLIFYDIAVMKVLGVPPPCLTFRMLKLQIWNKDGHQRKESEGFEGDQYHEDHHLVHRANFGFGHPMLDMYFGTYKGNNCSVQLGSTKFEKEEMGDGLVKFKVQVDGKYDAGNWQTLPFWQTWLFGKLGHPLR